MAGLNGFGRGRGTFLCTPVSSTVKGTARFLSEPITSTPMPDLENMSVGNDTYYVPSRSVGVGATNTENEGASVNLIAGIAQQIGFAIGESITSHIESKLHSGAGPDVAGHTNSLGGAGPSLVNLVVKSDIKEPVCFKGDDSDMCTVHEWETVLTTYFWKTGTPVTEQAEEVMSRLRGRAREVVRVVMRSNPSLDLSNGPAPVFDTLKQHFSDTVFSTMPLADFYATLPAPSECPFEYWLRLNRAMEMAEDCLKRQNKMIDNPSCELTAMFIRHCPDPELSLIFRCKASQLWTAAEVHEKLVEHKKDQRYSPYSKTAPAITSLRQEVSSTAHPTVPDGVLHNEASLASSSNQATQGSAGQLEHIIARLERLLEQRPQQAQFQVRSNPHFQRGRRNRARPLLDCEVCGDVGHDTRFHCRADHLCFLCFAPDHTSAICPKSTAVKPTGVVPTGPATPCQEN